MWSASRLGSCVRTEKEPVMVGRLLSLLAAVALSTERFGRDPSAPSPDFCASARSARPAQGNHAGAGRRQRADGAHYSRFRPDRPRWQQSAWRQSLDLSVAGRRPRGTRHRHRPHRQARHVWQQRGGRRRQCRDHRRLCRRRPIVDRGDPQADRRPVRLGARTQRRRSGCARRGAKGRPTSAAWCWLPPPAGRSAR